MNYFIIEYVRAFIASYNDADMILFGGLIKHGTPSGFKELLIETIEKDLEDYEDDYLRKVRSMTEDIVRKGKLLIETIK